MNIVKLKLYNKIYTINKLNYSLSLKFFKNYNKFIDPNEPIKHIKSLISNHEQIKINKKVPIPTTEKKIQDCNSIEPKKHFIRSHEETKKAETRQKTKSTETKKDYSRDKGYKNNTINNVDEFDKQIKTDEKDSNTKLPETNGGADWLTKISSKNKNELSGDTKLAENERRDRENVSSKHEEIGMNWLDKLTKPSDDFESNKNEIDYPKLLLNERSMFIKKYIDELDFDISPKTIEKVWHYLIRGKSFEMVKKTLE